LPLRARHLVLAAASLAILACDRSCSRDGGEADAGAAEAAVADATTTEAPADAPRDPQDAEAPAPVDAAASAVTDAGPSPCRRVYGPTAPPFRGPAALVMTDAALELVANDDGKPRVHRVPVTAPPAQAVVPPPAEPELAARWPACAVAGRRAYCQAPGGAIYRTTLGASDAKEIARSRSGTSIAAAPLGAERGVVAYLQSHATSEGETLEAFATVDEGAPVRLSAEGAGATLVKLVPRGSAAVAVYLDARAAMLPVHARPVSSGGGPGGLSLGEDAVLFLGGPPERGIDFAVAGAGRRLFALVPMAREITDFGMAVIPVGDPPKDDVAASWSFYPNGLDPAPIAATLALGETGRAWVARVRPREQEPTSPRVLELGRLDAQGAFESLGAIADGSRIRDLALAVDRFGAVWILYGNAHLTWLERRVCP
jgi:hypothetical protein